MSIMFPILMLNKIFKKQNKKMKTISENTVTTAPNNEADTMPKPRLKKATMKGLVYGGPVRLN